MKSPPARAIARVFDVTGDVLISLAPKSTTAPVALGVADGIGTARAFQESQTSGAFAGVAMGLNAILTALIAPIIIRLFT